jgi:hypothetical protein
MLSLSTVLAQGNISLKPSTEFNNLTGITFGGIVSGLISFIMIIAALVFFFMLILGGIQWMLSGGVKAGAEAARGIITAALIGLVIVFSAWAIVQLINAVFGVNILSLNMPTFFGTVAP